MSGGPSLTLRVCICAVCVAAFAGCSRNAAVSVSGSVTLDGALLDEATITFVPLAGGQRQAAWATTKSGRYSIDAIQGLGTGQFRVEIRALRASGDKNLGDPTLIAAKEIVPSKYNSKSTLAVDIKAGINKADFELKSR